jgi:hypothetical protein
MNRLPRVLESSVYLPLHPKNFKLLVRILRWFEWLPSNNAASEGIHRIFIVQPHNSLGDLLLSFPRFTGSGLNPKLISSSAMR